MAKSTAYSRAQKWYNRQVRAGRLRDSDYSALTRKMTLCYEPATMMNARNEVTNQDILQKAKELKAITDFKL